MGRKRPTVSCEAMEVVYITYDLSKLSEADYDRFLTESRQFYRENNVFPLGIGGGFNQKRIQDFYTKEDAAKFEEWLHKWK